MSDSINRMFINVTPTDDQQVPTQVTGTWPSWLQGDLIRVGPGKWDLSSDFSVNHWFDGCALLFKFSISPDHGSETSPSVTFQSRFAESDAFQKMTSCCRPVWVEFGTRAYPDPSKSFFGRMVGKLIPTDLTDNVIGNLLELPAQGGGQKSLFSVSETSYTWGVDRETLKVTQKVDMSRHAAPNLFSPHALIDPMDGSVYNIGTSFMTGLKHHVIRIPGPASQADSELNNNPKSGSPSKTKSLTGFETTETVASFPTAYKTAWNYMHSFAMSERYLIMVMSPLLISMGTLMTLVPKGKALREAMEWSTSEMTKFLIIEKATGRVLTTTVKYLADPLFVLHCINAYEVHREQGSFLVVDVISYEDDKIFDKFLLDRLRSGEWAASHEPTPRRFVLPLDAIEEKTSSTSPTGGDLLPTDEDSTKIFKSCQAIKLKGGEIHLKPGKVCPPGLELPGLNPAHVGRPYRYFYGSGTFEKRDFKNAIAKVDLDTGEVLKWTGSETQYPGEPIFVSKPGSSVEDEGVVLVVVADLRTDSSSFLLVLDSRDLTELGRAAVPANIQVPVTFHGRFIPRN